VQAFLGRFFDESEDHPPAGENVVVLSYEYWLAHYQGASDVLGKQMQIGSAQSGNSYTIIGIAPRGFTGPALRRVDLWTPMSTGAPVSDNWATTWNSRWLEVYGRLKPGITPEQAAADLTATYRAGYTGSHIEHKQATLTVAPLRFSREKKKHSRSR
jgi:hypothetical protein